ncbi:hypothetical protein BGX27_006155, partial [Mortierella sp. AM989]
THYPYSSKRPPDSANMARQLLDRLSQNKPSVADYTRQFLCLLRLIPTMDADTALYMYLSGLEEDTRKEVRLRQPTTLDVAITMATISHSILNPNKPQPTVGPPTTNPMAMDIDNMRIQINALQQQLHNRGSGYSPESRSLPRLNDSERTRLFQRGACFRCRRDDHQACNCPSRNGRSFNNMSSNGGFTPDFMSRNVSGSQD